MFSLIVLSTVTLIAFVAHHSVFKRLALPRHGWLIWTTAGLTATGALLTILMTNDMTGQLSQKDWPIVDGIIVSSEVTGERAFHPRVVYRYYIDGILHTDSSDLHVPGFGGKRKRMEVAEKLVALYWKGDTVEVHYDPDRPVDSYLESSLRWGTFGRLGFGLTLYLAGILMFLSLRRKNAKKETV